jgi:ribose transport system substrate-binding protein
VEPIGGRAAGLAILRDYPEPGSIDALFTVNDGGGLGVVEVLAEAGRTEILHVTVDGDPQSVENIRQQRLTRIDSAQFCGPMGAEALRATLAVLAGETRDEPILIPTFPITLETLARYTGWLGPIPPSFVKPWQALEPVWRGRTASQTP